MQTETDSLLLAEECVFPARTADELSMARVGELKRNSVDAFFGLVKENTEKIV
jgi:hypothetical protein